MDPRYNKTIRIVMLPWLAHGHISPFLELAKALTSRNFSIYLCSTPVNLASIKEKLTQKDSASITLVELNLPSLPDLPPHYHTTNGLPPHLMPALKTAFDMSEPTFSNLLDTLKPDLLIYDFLHPFAPQAASARNIPSVLFLSPGAASSSYINKILKRPSLEFPSSAIYFRDYEKAKVLDRMVAAVSNDLKDVDRFGRCVEQTSNIVLIRTSGALEGKYIDYLSVLIEKRVVPGGPLVQEVVPMVDEKSEVLRWLDEKPRCSTVFVCFGTEYFLSREEMQEIAHGLELSNVDFVWVVRFPSLGDEKISRVEEVLPEGFLERVKGRGMVVEGWAPQGRILRHGSVGGFVSHCGWGSVMESVVFGVPIVALPMHLDQPLNSRLVEEVGVGMEVGRDASGRIERERVARGVREVLKGESGESMRRKAKELSEEMRKKGEEEMDLAVEEIVKLCRN